MDRRIECAQSGHE